MICFHVYGGLGNQMFIYAYAQNLHLTYKKEYCLSKLGKLKYFELTDKDYYFNNIKFLGYKLIEKLLKLSKRLEMRDAWKNHKEEFLKHKGNLTLDGYFQGEYYFFEVKEEVKKRLEFKGKYKRLFEDFRKKHLPEEKILTIHFRRTDYQNHFNDMGLGSGGLVLPDSYYLNALQLVDVQKYKVVFISDDIEYVKDKFGHLKNAFFSTESDIIDLQILMHSEVVIMANSTFSWWGAWLNKKKEKRILVPDYFLGFKVDKEFPIQIIPRGWERVKVY